MPNNYRWPVHTTNPKLVMRVTFHYAQTEAERAAIYRLRYEIYVEEMQIFGEVANHDSRTLLGPNDATARLLYAMKDGEIIGTLRLNLGGDAPFAEEMEHTYNLDRFRPAVDDAQTLILTRFMVGPEYRGTNLAYLMIEEVARLSMQEGIELAFCDCQPHLIRYYQRMGFRCYACDVYNDPEFGIMTPMLFILKDLSYLKDIRSPLQTVLSAQQANEKTVKEITALIGHPPVKDVSQLEAGVYGKMKDVSGVSLFQGMEEADVQSVLSNGYLMQLSENDRVIRKGQNAMTVFVVLSGTLEIREGGHVIASVNPGECVGELAFLLSVRRTADVYVGSECAQVLVLDEGRLRKRFKSRSKVAANLLYNMSKTMATRMASLVNNLTARVDLYDNISAV